jgi:hypothetical protein
MPETGYSIDLNKFSLKKLKYNIENTRILPSQQILQEDIDDRFACLEQHGIENLQQLQAVLKTKSKVQSFAEETGLPVDYLTILRREVNSYQPKPIQLKDFPGVDPDVIQKLDQIGIKHTKQLFPYILTREDRCAFAEQNQLADDDILELTRLTDIARLKWVGPKFAKLLIESPYNTVEKIANSDCEALYFTLAEVNKEKEIYKGNIGIEDLKSWIHVVVQDVPQVIQY